LRITSFDRLHNDFVFTFNSNFDPSLYRCCDTAANTLFSPTPPLFRAPLHRTAAKFPDNLGVQKLSLWTTDW